jgi:hypothetical protein
MKKRDLNQKILKYNENVEKEIIKEISNKNIKRKPSIINQSSFVFKPDFMFKIKGKTYLVETKNNVKPNDIALVKGMASGSKAQPVIISPEKIDKNTSKLANELNIKLLSGSPSEVVRKLKDIS